ncbi:MAG: hypothetical protein ACKOFI_03960, partial [Phycisphaerales bacterium]
MVICLCAILPDATSLSQAASADNLVRMSEAIDRPPWSTSQLDGQKFPTAAIVSPDVESSPAGTKTADHVGEVAVVNYQGVRQGFTDLKPSAVYRVSFHAKAAERTRCSANSYVTNTE